MFNQRREFLTGTLQIALRCGAPILQGFVESRKNYYFHLHVKGPLYDPAMEADEPTIVNEVMQAYADNIAEHLREHPDHISKT
jgi:lauroyl/myristoyl acyltransferase